MTAPSPVAAPRETPGPSPRLIAWADGAGAFLLCLGESATLGNAAGDADVKLAADLGRRHAAVVRSGEGYVVEAFGPALVAHEGPPGRTGSGRVVAGRTDFNVGDELVLYREGGSGVRLRLSRPNALTATALLTVAGDGRTVPRFDAVVLMAEACVFGPGRDAHVRCPHATGSVLLFRRDGGLWARSAEPLTVGGRPVEGAAPVGHGDTVAGAGVCFRLEEA